MCQEFGDGGVGKCAETEEHGVVAEPSSGFCFGDGLLGLSADASDFDCGGAAHFLDGDF